MRNGSECVMRGDGVRSSICCKDGAMIYCNVIVSSRTSGLTI